MLVSAWRFVPESSGTFRNMNNRKPDPADEKPHENRDVPSDRPYVEDASVPGDNDPNTALDPELEERVHHK